MRAEPLGREVTPKTEMVVAPHFHGVCTTMKCMENEKKVTWYGACTIKKQGNRVQAP
jgi:hypothetical protein